MNINQLRSRSLRYRNPDVDVTFKDLTRVIEDLEELTTGGDFDGAVSATYIPYATSANTFGNSNLLQNSSGDIVVAYDKSIRGTDAMTSNIDFGGLSNAWMRLTYGSLGGSTYNFMTLDEDHIDIRAQNGSAARVYVYTAGSMIMGGLAGDCTLSMSNVTNIATLNAITAVLITSGNGAFTISGGVAGVIGDHIEFHTNGVERWNINTSGSFVPILDNTYDIGNGLVNPRDITASRYVIADTINEKTAAAGVTVDSVLLKDGTVKTGAGAVADVSLKVNADGTGFYEVSATQLGAAIGGVLVAMFDTNGIATGVISEQVFGVGVTIDGVLCKDGTLLTAIGDASAPGISLGTLGNGFYEDSGIGVAISGALTYRFGGSSFQTNAITEISLGSGVTIDSVLLKDGGVSTQGVVAFGGTPQSLNGPGAINLTTFTTLITTTGADAFTLADGIEGQFKYIQLDVNGGDATITPSNLRGGTTITMNTVDDFVYLYFIDGEWSILSNNGCTIA